MKNTLRNDSSEIRNHFDHFFASPVRKLKLLIRKIKIKSDEMAHRVHRVHINIPLYTEYNAPFIKYTRHIIIIIK